MKRAFFALTIIFLINIFSMYHSWYLRFFWFDMVLHFWAGFFVAMFMAYYLKSNLGENKLKNLLILIGTTAFVGMVWEFIEYIANQTLTGLIYDNLGIKTYFIGDLSDTMSDLLMDILGACFFAGSVLHPFWRRKAHQVETNS